MKIGENDYTHEIQFLISFYFDDLHLQLIESISPKASVENSVGYFFYPTNNHSTSMTKLANSDACLLGKYLLY